MEETTPQNSHLKTYIVLGTLVVVAAMIIFFIIVISFRGGTNGNNESRLDSNALRLQFIENAQKNANGISGQIQQIDVQGGTKKLDVQIQISDLASLSSGDLTLSTTSLPKLISKTITILVDGETTIEGTSDFKIGDTVKALLNKSVYQGTFFHAIKISTYNRVEEIKRQVFNLNLIHGSIEKLEGDLLVIKTKVPNKAKATTLNFSGEFTVPYIDKEYQVLIDKSTQFIGGKKSDLKVGGSISVWGEGDLLSMSSLTATKILIEQQ